MPVRGWQPVHAGLETLAATLAAQGIPEGPQRLIIYKTKIDGCSYTLRMEGRPETVLARANKFRIIARRSYATESYREMNRKHRRYA